MANFEAQDRATGMLLAAMRHLERFRATGDPAVLDEAVRQARAARIAVLADDPDNTVPAHGVLADALRARFTLRGRRDDLDAAIDELRAAAASTARTSPGHSPGSTPGNSPGTSPGNRVQLLASLANCLLARADGTQSVADVRAALDVLRDALTGTPSGQRRGQLLNGLGNALVRLHERTGEPEPLDEALRAYDESLDLHPADDPDYPTALAALANCYERLYRDRGDVHHLEQAVALFRYGVSLRPSGHDRRRYLGGLAYALRQRYDARGEPGDLQECIEVFRVAVAAYGPEEPGQFRARHSLVQALRAEHLRSGDVRVLHEAAEVSAGTTRLPTAPVGARIEAFGMYGHVQASLGRWAAAADALAAAVALLPRLASADRIRVDQQYDVGETAGIAGAAAACALNAGRPERALELLEHGRGVLFAKRLAPRGGSDARLPTARELLAVAGPVVLVTTSRYRCDALVLRGGRLDVVRLPDLTDDDAYAGSDVLRSATAAALDAGLRARERLAAQQTVREVLGWLWRTTVRPVLDHLGPVPRVWWCPIGPMTFHPLHAAEEPGGESALDRVVSSYVPTVSVLHHLRSRAGRAGAADVDGADGDGAGGGRAEAVNRVGDAGGAASRSCVVAVGAGRNGLPALPHAAEEARIAAAALPGARLVTGADATRESVLALLADSGFAHFACHAVADAHDPGAGRLVLSDDLPLSDLTGLGLDHAELAYLSACSTTRSAPRLADEALHLTGGFQFAGFRHVIGTLWETDDASALEITRRFYPGRASPARALHDAVRALRARYPAAPTLWAGHVHSGV